MTGKNISLLAALNYVAQLRVAANDLISTISLRRRELEAELQPELKALEDRGAELNHAEIIVREIALMEYGTTGEKSLLGGIKVRINTNLVFNDCEAETWCETNMPIAFKRVWNRKLFTDFARRNDLPFVTREELPEVTLPREIALPASEEAR